MAVGQLWLFDPPKPLVERFGSEFFRALPERPGVYLMCGATEGVLYVGKARNLRKRLAAYRVANPERMSRRTIRLLHQTRRIEWDECSSEEAACCREELLICVLAPKFNSVGKVWPQRAGSPHQGMRRDQCSVFAGQLWSRCGRMDPAKTKGPESAAAIEL
jgi:predicted GIY-YIG superfamily endonuclease